ncbi:unnamed protein product, partial [Discosporangium mesarthrocarpum]
MEKANTNATHDAPQGASVAHLAETELSPAPAPFTSFAPNPNEKSAVQVASIDSKPLVGVDDRALPVTASSSVEAVEVDTATVDNSFVPVTSTHIKEVMSLKMRGRKWSSEVTEVWIPEEVSYVEFLFVLFHDGVLANVEVGLTFKEFVADMLGCDQERVSKKFAGDKRLEGLAFPARPEPHALGPEQLQGLSARLADLERDFLIQRAATSQPRKRARTEPSGSDQVDTET